MQERFESFWQFCFCRNYSLKLENGKNKYKKKLAKIKLNKYKKKYFRRGKSRIKNKQKKLKTQSKFSMRNS